MERWEYGGRIVRKGLCVGEEEIERRRGEVRTERWLNAVVGRGRHSGAMNLDCC